MSLVWTAKNREVIKLALHTARQGLEYAAERASLSGSEPVVGSQGVAFVFSAALPAALAFLAWVWHIRAY